jgi:hypothetical protein
MFRKARGQGDSLFLLDNAGAQGRAKRSAKAELKKALASECDPVPCPKCGSYQHDMVEKLCREYRMWMWWAGIFAIFGAVLCGALGYTLFETDRRAVGLCLFAAGFGGMMGGIASIVLRRHMAYSFEPNQTPLKQRLAIAEERAQKVKDFADWYKANKAKEEEMFEEG